MATPDDLRDELAALTVTLRDVETTLSTLAQGLVRHPPGDLVPVLDELARLRQLLVSAPRRPSRWPWAMQVAALGLGLWAGSVAWEAWRGSRQPPGDSMTLFREVDQVLVANYKQIGPLTQEQLHAVYTKAGLQSPGERQRQKP